MSPTVKGVAFEQNAVASLAREASKRLAPKLLERPGRGFGLFRRLANGTPERLKKQNAMARLAPKAAEGLAVGLASVFCARCRDACTARKRENAVA